MYTIEQKGSAKTWRPVRFSGALFDFQAALDACERLDQDGVLINVRIKDPTGHVIQSW